MTELPNDRLAAAFQPHAALAADLLPHATDPGDGAHDTAHILRVFRNAMRIQAQEGGNARILAAAVLLHDCVAVEKNSPLRKEASRLAAERAFLLTLDGSCQTPIAGLAVHDGTGLWLRGEILRPDGSAVLAGERRMAVADGAAAGADLARALLAEAGPGFFRD